LSAISIDVLNNFAFAMTATSGVMVAVLIAVLLQNQNEIARYLREDDSAVPSTATAAPERTVTPSDSVTVPSIEPVTRTSSPSTVVGLNTALLTSRSGS